jgi:hypothetical protein
LQHLPAGTGQTGVGDRSPENSTVDQQTPAREGTRRGMCTLGCSMVGRPPRTSSNALEMREEQHGRLEK